MSWFIPIKMISRFSYSSNILTTFNMIKIIWILVPEENAKRHPHEHINTKKNFKKQTPVGTGMSRARNLRWGMLLHVNEAGIYGGQVMYIMWALQYIHDNLSKWHKDCWVMHTKWYPSVRFDEENPSYT